MFTAIKEKAKKILDTPVPIGTVLLVATSLAVAKAVMSKHLYVRVIVNYCSHL